MYAFLNRRILAPLPVTQQKPRSAGQRCGTSLAPLSLRATTAVEEKDSAFVPYTSHQYSDLACSDRIRVLYDASVLGVGHTIPAARTGIFRVVERIAHGLSLSTSCDLTLCAHQSLHAWSDTHDYLSSSSTLCNTELINPGRLRSWERMLTRWLTQINQRSQLGVSMRLLRKGVWVARRAVEHQYRSSTLLQAGSFDIFHSPLDALRERASAPARARFLTVYDLIPARLPHFCNDGVPESMEAVYQSLCPDDWALAISESTKSDLCEHRGIDPARVFVTSLAADEELFYPCGDPNRLRSVRERYSIPEGPYILSLNTLEPRKNLDHAIRSFASLVRQERVPDLRLVLVGAKGWRYERIFAAIKNAGLASDRIVLTGYVADEDLAPLYSGALAFVYPSFYEGFGLPPLEAMQCGVPVITSNTSALPEVVGSAGILLDPMDVDGLAHSMLQLYQDSSLREQMAFQSLMRAEQFSWKRCVDETIAAYRTALSA